MKKFLKEILGIINCIRFKIGKFGKKVYIGKGNRIIGGKNIEIGENVSIRPYGFIACNKNSTLKIKKNTDIGTRVRIGCSNKITIGENVLFGPNIYIADQDHKYTDIDIPIIKQGTKIFDDGIEIGDDSWIGINAVIIGNVKIGKHCIIGANSLVNKNIPAYSVAVGNPAKVIKKYNFIKKEWEKII